MDSENIAPNDPYWYKTELISVHLMFALEPKLLPLYIASIFPNEFY